MVPWAESLLKLPRAVGAFRRGALARGWRRPDRLREKVGNSEMKNNRQMNSLFHDKLDFDFTVESHLLLFGFHCARGRRTGNRSGRRIARRFVEAQEGEQVG